MSYNSNLIQENQRKNTGESLNNTEKKPKKIRPPGFHVGTAGIIFGVLSLIILPWPCLIVGAACAAIALVLSNGKTGIGAVITVLIALVLNFIFAMSRYH